MAFSGSFVIWFKAFSSPCFSFIASEDACSSFFVFNFWSELNLEGKWNLRGYITCQPRGYLESEFHRCRAVTPTLTLNLPRLLLLIQTSQVLQKIDTFQTSILHGADIVCVEAFWGNLYPGQAQCHSNNACWRQWNIFHSLGKMIYLLKITESINDTGLGHIGKYAFMVSSRDASLISADLRKFFLS